MNGHLYFIRSLELSSDSTVWHPITWDDKTLLITRQDLNELRQAGAELLRRSDSWCDICNFLAEKMLASKREAASFEDHRRWEPRQCLDVSRNGMSVITKEDCMRSGANESIWSGESLDCCPETLFRDRSVLQDVKLFWRETEWTSLVHRHWLAAFLSTINICIYVCCVCLV